MSCHSICSINQDGRISGQLGCGRVFVGECDVMPPETLHSLISKEDVTSPPSILSRCAMRQNMPIPQRSVSKRNHPITLRNETACLRFATGRLAFLFLC